MILMGMMANPVVRVLSLVVLVVMLTYGGMAAARVALNTDSPIMVVPSTSMVPTLNVGDIVIIRGVDPATITVGTIIVYEAPGNTIDIIHRVISIVHVGSDLYFKTKGDHNPSPDPWTPGVPAKNVKGVLVSNIPYIGYITLTLQGLPGLALIGCLVFLMILFEYRDAGKKKEKERNSQPARFSTKHLTHVLLCMAISSIRW